MTSTALEGTREGTSEVVVLEGVSKIFKTGFFRTESRAVLKDVSLRLQRGSAFGFLGPNGAGKTTTIKLLVGLISQSAGRISLFGEPPSDRRSRERLGYLPENPALPDGLTGREALQLMWALGAGAKSRRAAELARVLKLVDLTEAADTIIRKYSKGMVQRLGIAQALLNDPDLVILDEPMSGLDPVGRREMKDIILELRRSGKTIFFSTHIISDVEEICDEVAIIVKGRLARSGSVVDLIGRDVRRFEVLATSVPPDFSIAPVSTGAVSQFSVEKESELRPLLEALWTKGAQVRGVKPTRYGLEDVFIEAVRSGASGELRDARAEGRAS